jgi:hypothetical protein
MPNGGQRFQECGHVALLGTNNARLIEVSSRDGSDLSMRRGYKEVLNSTTGEYPTSKHQVDGRRPTTGRKD